MNTGILNVLKSVNQLSAPGFALMKYNTFCSMTPDALEAKLKVLKPNLTDRAAIILIDVLRASTTTTACGAAGALAIKIDVKRQDGHSPFSSPPTDTLPWVGGGEEHGRALPGAAIGNSPTEITLEQFAGKALHFHSTNGAQVVRLAEESGCKHIFMVTLCNIEATLDVATKSCDSFVIGLGGFYKAVSLEDVVAAGRIIESLLKRGACRLADLDDEARSALAVARAHTDDEHLVKVLEEAQVGRLLASIGHGADVRAVVTGEGIDPRIWTRMRRIVLKFGQLDGIGVFFPTLTIEEKP